MKQRHIQTFLMVSAAFFAMSATAVNAAEAVPGAYAGVNASAASLAVAATQAQGRQTHDAAAAQPDIGIRAEKNAA
jgi:hypothetical protein